MSNSGKQLYRPNIPAKLVAIGDSITASNENEINFNGSTNALYQDSWFTYACAFSGGLLKRYRNVGIPGQTSVQMAARFYTDVVANKPSSVIILCGTNDVGQSVAAGGSTPNATAIVNFKTSIQRMVNASWANNITPILCTIPPNNATARHALITQLNLWIKVFAASNGITLLDFYGQAADPTTGNYLTSWNTSDGTHPGAAGQALFGQYVSNKLSPLVGVNAPFVCQDNADSDNLITNPLYLGGALSAQGIPPGWQIASGYPTGVTVSYVTDSNVGGNMWQVAANASSAPYYVQFPIPSAKWNPGDVLAACGILTSNAGVTPSFSFQNQSGTLGHQASSQAMTRGYLYLEQITTSATTQLYLQLNTPQGTGTWSIGQVGVYNLTQLGLV